MIPQQSLLPPQIRPFSFLKTPQQQNDQGDSDSLARPITVNIEQNVISNSVPPPSPSYQSSTPPWSLVVDSLVAVTSTISSSHHSSPCVPSFVESSSSQVWVYCMIVHMHVLLAACHVIYIFIFLSRAEAIMVFLRFNYSLELTIKYS